MSSRFSRGMSTPAIRAMSALPLLVTRVGADNHDAPMATDHFAVITHFLNAGFDLQRDYL